MKSYFRLCFLILIIFLNLGFLHSNPNVQAHANPIGDSTIHDTTFTNVDIEAEFPGGSHAWLKYLAKHMRYPDEAAKGEIQGDIMVKFIVDDQGNVSDIQAIRGPNELRGEAIRLIMLSGKWTPAVYNGHQVNSYKYQAIKWRLAIR
jgi:protein TonB